MNNCYLACDVHPEHLAAALEGARRMHFLGLNLTVPHKVMALEMMDTLDQTAERWGAVNTVLFEGYAPGGSWKPLGEFVEELPSEVRSRGFNTDAYGFTTSLKQDLGLYLEGSRVMLLGAGGAGRVAALQLAEEGASELFIVERMVERAEEVAAEIRRRHPEVHIMLGYPHREVDLLINATPLGLKPEDPLPLVLDRFPLTDTKAVYDMVYRPAETRLLSCAREAGVRAVNGSGMLLHQGVKAFEIWTDRTAPVDVMKTALHKEIYGS